MMAEENKIEWPLPIPKHFSPALLFPQGLPAEDPDPEDTMKLKYNHELVELLDELKIEGKKRAPFIRHFAPMFLRIKLAKGQHYDAKHAHMIAEKLVLSPSEVEKHDEELPFYSDRFGTNFNIAFAALSLPQDRRQQIEQTIYALAQTRVNRAINPEGYYRFPEAQVPLEEEESKIAEYFASLEADLKRLNRRVWTYEGKPTRPIRKRRKPVDLHRGEGASGCLQRWRDGRCTAQKSRIESTRCRNCASALRVRIASAYRDDNFVYSFYPVCKWHSYNPRERHTNIFIPVNARPIANWSHLPAVGLHVYSESKPRDLLEAERKGIMPYSTKDDWDQLVATRLETIQEYMDVLKDLAFSAMLLGLLDQKQWYEVYQRKLKNKQVPTMRVRNETIPLQLVCWRVVVLFSRLIGIVSNFEGKFKTARIRRMAMKRLRLIQQELVQTYKFENLKIPTTGSAEMDRKLESKAMAFAPNANYRFIKAFAETYDLDNVPDFTDDDRTAYAHEVDYGDEEEEADAGAPADGANAGGDDGGGHDGDNDNDHEGEEDSKGNSTQPQPADEIGELDLTQEVDAQLDQPPDHKTELKDQAPPGLPAGSNSGRALDDFEGDQLTEPEEVPTANKPSGAKKKKRPSRLTAPKRKPNKKGAQLNYNYRTISFAGEGLEARPLDEESKHAGGPDGNNTPSGGKGSKRRERGIFALRSFAKNDVITEYVGQIIPQSELKRREDKKKSDDFDVYVMEIADTKKLKGGPYFIDFLPLRDDLEEKPAEELKGLGLGAMANEPLNAGQRANAMAVTVNDPPLKVNPFSDASHVPKDMQNKLKSHRIIVVATKKIKKHDQIFYAYNRKES